MIAHLLLQCNPLRWKAGVASSLNYISLRNDAATGKSPLLRPYPSWEANTIVPTVAAASPSPNGAADEAKGRADAPTAVQSTKALRDNATIVSTFRIRVDECDRLWVMDTGLADILGSPEQIAPAALVIFDLKTDQLIRRFEFAAEDAKEDTFFANVVSTMRCDANRERCASD